MSTILAVDIETKISDYGRKHLEEKEYLPDSRLKDPAKIKASVESQREKDIDKAALHWWLSKIICICAITYDTRFTKTFSGDDERLLLKEFFTHLENNGPYVQLVGKSSISFDIPFLVGRALALNLGLPDCLRQNIEKITDVDQLFSRFRMCSQITSLSNYAFGLGIEGKLAKGGDVAKMHEEERWDEIEQYCRRDTEIVCEMIKRYQKPFTAVEF